MFGSLVRWLGAGNEGRGAGPAVRFTPQLEALDLRANPGGRGGIGGEVFTGSYAAVTEMHIGEEIPQQARAVTHHPDGSKPGGTGEGVSDAAEVVHGAWVGGPTGGQVITDDV